MILTDISGKIKGIPDISPNIFAILAILLSLLGGYFASSIIGREYAREGSLQVLFADRPTFSPKESEAGELSQGKGKYVASRSGSFYYLPTCSGAKRIKEKNQVWFQSKDDAEARGLKPSASCPGL